MWLPTRVKTVRGIASDIDRSSKHLERLEEGTVVQSRGSSRRRVLTYVRDNVGSLP